ncbi:tRNA lysidine(34) synthetase TilS [Sphingomonas sp.]|uniref:tRNA lysidine(34) synthetase TilS n=1 Tax=Sphingomonas sp. TaxID=28214 RepID=UPI0025F50683|nr:tRNA lysidine(34) synthetase TilS [Sphingomonas sp.]
MPPTSASDLTPPAEQVARFRRDLLALTGEAPTPKRRLGLGVSGGPDSMALLLLAAAAFPDALCVATVDHGLRPEAAEEAALVAGVCARLGVPHATLAPPPGFSFAGNMQERARMLRYTVLGEWARSSGAPWVAIAHQRDDVAETLLMRARRGSGVAGLAAMRRARAIAGGTLLVRPLLDWSRAELEGLAACKRVPIAKDRSNRDPRYDRSRIRALIAASPDLVPSRLALSAQNLRHAEEAIEWALAREAPARLRSDDAGTVTLDAAGLPYELRRRLVRVAVQQVRDAAGEDARWHEQGLDRLVATLDAGGTGTIAGVKASAKYGEWRFSAAPPRRSH